MRIAVIENRLKDYIINIFNQHPDLRIELAGFLDWKPQYEKYQEISIGKIEELDNGQYDAILIAIKENCYLSRLLTYLHKKHIQNVYIVRLFALDTQEDFLSETQPMNLDGTRVDRMPQEDEKPYLVHLETHVCDHCNLNCKACNNFSPFVKEPSYADINQFERDLKRLTELFSGIGRFFLLGGEPMLAPELCCDMIRCFRKYFPTNELRVLTNATLVFSMKDEFWDCIRENDVIIHISLYPPMKEKINEIREKLENEKVRYLVFKEVETFAKHWTAYPFEDEKYNNEHCGSAGCHYLRNGEISKCPDAILVDFMAEGNAELSSLRLNERETLSEIGNAWDLIEKIDNPIDLCKKCTYKRLKRTRWERVDNKANSSDWLLPHRYEYEVEKANDEIKKLRNRIENLNNRVEEQNRRINSNRELITTYELKERELKRKCNDVNNLLEYTQQEYERVNNSYSHKIGRFITWLPRKIKKIAKSAKNKIAGSGIFKICYLFNAEILKGYNAYKNVLLEYQDQSVRKIFYMEYSGSGDTYLSCSYLSSIGEINNNDIFIAPSQLAAKIAGYYDFKRVEIIEGSCAFSVREMERFCQNSIYWHSLLYESDPLIYSGIMRHIQGYKGFDFMTLLKIGYEVNLGVEYTEKKWEQNLLLSSDICSIFQEKNLPKGNTVLIAPYAGMNSLFGISFEFYCSIAQKLKKLGFVVCTNSNNSYNDRPIPDTIPVFLPHEQMIKFCEDAGYFIGTRSGLCDIISNSKIKRKIIVYPDQKISEGVGKWIDFFSLKKMGLCDDAIEYNYNKDEEQVLIKEIIESFTCQNHRDSFY